QKHLYMNYELCNITIKHDGFFYFLDSFQSHLSTHFAFVDQAFWFDRSFQWRVDNQSIECFDVLKAAFQDRKSTRLNSSHVKISYAVFCLKKKNIVDLQINS